jgi:hypothetical protein
MYISLPIRPFRYSQPRLITNEGLKLENSAHINKLDIPAAADTVVIHIHKTTSIDQWQNAL